jgi:glucosamine-6-phosphate deaminase
MNLDENHPAGFRRYLREKFTSKVSLGAVHFVEGTRENIEVISREILSAPIDVGFIGIGENSHIAFNDPPANFDVEDPYIVVALNDTCKKQQVGEGWFKTEADVPTHAVSMSVKQIMRCRHIVSCVPYAVKAQAVYDTLTKPLSNMTPATMLKEHDSFTLYIDNESASLLRVPFVW